MSRTRSSEFGAAMSRSAEKRRCPKCQRKSALVRVPTDFKGGVESVTYCRWDDCDYQREGFAIASLAARAVLVGGDAGLEDPAFDDSQGHGEGRLKPPGLREDAGGDGP